jgi:hypothetical protein
MTEETPGRLTLPEIIKLTGHAHNHGAYHALRRAGKKPCSYRSVEGRKGGPLAEFTKDDVMRVFGTRIQNRA